MDELAGLPAPATPPPVMDILEIQTYLPHRHPFLFVDRIIELEKYKRAVGLKNVTHGEPFFVGHFPGHPVMPAVLILEAMAQVAGILAFYSLGGRGDHIPLFTGIDKAKFRAPVVPGDQLRMELEVRRRRGDRIWTFAGKSSVDGKLAAEAELQAMMVANRP
jgi:3-hydroxyacyl-[acyl-carrier-protein] dehydratase